MTDDRSRSADYSHLDDLGTTGMVHGPAIPRVKDVVTKDQFGDDMLAAMTAVAADAELHQSDTGQCVVTFIDDGDEFVEGEWVPELWIVMRKVLPDGEDQIG